MTNEAIRALLEDMTLEEKIGQLIQVPPQVLSSNGVITGPAGEYALSESDRDNMGSVLNVTGAARLRKIQDAQMERQPHHIPMLFMMDVINGFETIFPIPLAQGCSFSPTLVEKGAAAAAAEAAAAGVHVTFSPMVDLVRDSRWGRVMESTGEDPWLNARMGEAMVRGYQGTDLKEKGRIAACVKHFAAYGAAEGGRDYDCVELSERTLREYYLPAYEAAIRAGSRLVMTSFNTIGGVPSTGNRWLMEQVLRREMGFDGVLISDYSAVEEMITHGFAEDTREATRLAMQAGLDMDMVSSGYVGHLAELVRCGEIPEEAVDRAAERVLRLKNDLGLFEKPYKDGSEEGEKQLHLCEAHRKLAREMAAETFVLLKNEGILPLSKKQKTAFIGPYVHCRQLHGSWSFPSDPEHAVPVREGVENAGAEDVCFLPGCHMLDADMPTRFEERLPYDEAKAETWLREAVEAARNAEQVVLCLGEHRDQTGEAGSRTELTLPECQLRLLREVCRVNQNVAVVCFSGRPMEMAEVAQQVKALLMVWMPGSEGGNAVADVLFGDAEPRGRLCMTFPRKAAQLPLYYNHLNTGRPRSTDGYEIFRTGYMGGRLTPAWPFGFGMSYTTFHYSPVTLSADTMTAEEKIVASVELTNTGDKAGTETVQLYLRDVAASAARPVRMLRGVEKVTLQPGQRKTVRFEITEEMLRFHTGDMTYASEPGRFVVHIAPNSGVENPAEFRLVSEGKKDSLNF